MNIKKILISGAIGLSALGLAAATVFAVGSNGSFENGTYVDGGSGFETLPASSTNINDWTIDSGDIDWIGSLWQPSDQTMSLDLNGFMQGSISQSLNTVVGATYTVTFDMSGNPGTCPQDQPSYCSPDNKQLTVNATNGGSPTQYSYNTVSHGNTFGNMMWEQHIYTFVATSNSSVLSIASNIVGAFGPAIDNVKITETLNTFPVPAECDQNIVYNHIVGSGKAETINGTSGNDYIEGKGGADRIDGKGGNDCIVGGDGADTLTGGQGDDVLLGKGGADTLNGNDGNDKLYGASGADSMYGGSGDDYLNGGADADRADGGTQITSDTCIAEVKTSCEL